MDGLPNNSGKVYSVRDLSGRIICCCMDSEIACADAMIIAGALKERYREKAFFVYVDNEIYRVFPAYEGEERFPSDFINC
ncbi:MAG: hypothetical protein IJY09_06365 [Lachnospiraceae bacterium]|nr:hypothetical protein [Lachnospiraceae bacterium]